MSTIALQQISKLLEAKSHSVNPMDRGATMKDLSEALNIPQQTVSSALSNQLNAAKFGIYKLTAGRQRYILWAYSLQVANKANGLPFETDVLAGIDPEVQTAEVNKLVEACPNSEDHTAIIDVRDALDSIIVRHGLSVSRGTVLGMAMKLADDYYNEQGENND